MQIDGLTALVTGGASGLGGATAKALAQAGAKVVILDLNEDKGTALADDIGGLFQKVNVTDEAQVRDAFAAAEACYGCVRIAVNCAGIGVAQKTVSKGAAHPLDQFKKVIEVNLVGSFNVARIAAERMIAHGLVSDEERGVIINTASIAAYDGQIGQIAYAASKGGIVGLTLPMARDLARDKIRVMTIAPGLFYTPLLMGLPQDALDSLSATVPHPARLGDPKEYGAMARHIVENPMLNGEVIRLDGALRMAPR